MIKQNMYKQEKISKQIYWGRTE